MSIGLTVKNRRPDADHSHMKIGALVLFGLPVAFILMIASMVALGRRWVCSSVEARRW